MDKLLKTDAPQIKIGELTFCIQSYRPFTFVRLHDILDSRLKFEVSLRWPYLNIPLTKGRVNSKTAAFLEGIDGQGLAGQLSELITLPFLRKYKHRTIFSCKIQTCGWQGTIREMEKCEMPRSYRCPMCRQPIIDENTSFNNLSSPNDHIVFFEV